MVHQKPEKDMNQMLGRIAKEFLTDTHTVAQDHLLQWTITATEFYSNSCLWKPLGLWNPQDITEKSTLKIQAGISKEISKVRKNPLDPHSNYFPSIKNISTQWPPNFTLAKFH